MPARCRAKAARCRRRDSATRYTEPATLAIRVECPGPVDDAARAQLDEIVAAHPEAVDARFARAVLLDERHAVSAARAAYKDVLARDAAHYGALTNLATLRFRDGALAEARTLYRFAANVRPDEPAAHVNLGNVYAAANDADAAHAAYDRALVLDASFAAAAFAKALLFDDAGDRENARAFRARAFAQPIVREIPFFGSAGAVRVLVLISAAGANLDTDVLIDARTMSAVTLVAESYHGTMRLPPHDLILNAIGDAERSADALTIAERIIARSGAPAVNRPDAVRSSVRAQQPHGQTFRAFHVGGALYPTHAPAAGRAMRGRVERGYLTDMTSVIGARALASLRVFAATLALDIAGIDFGVEPDGRIDIIAASPAMQLGRPEDNGRAAWRRPAVERIVVAARDLLAVRARAD